MTADTIITTFVHEDGSITHIVPDLDGEHSNPRNNDGCVATLVNLNNRTIDIDESDVYGLAEARDQWQDKPALVFRWLAMFHPEILHYDEHWSAGDSYGYGYVTRENWEKWMGADYDGDVTPEKAFDQEVNVYGQWANGEVYGYVHIQPMNPCPTCGQNTATDDSVWGFLGYDDHRQIAEQASNSPIVEER